MWGRENYDFFDLKSVLIRSISSLSLGPGISFEPGPVADFLHPGASALVSIGGKPCGYIGELHPDFNEKLDIDRKVYILEADLDLILDSHLGISTRFTPLPKYPGVRRDISVVVNDDILVGDIIEQVKGVSELIEDVWVFDIFQGESLGEGKKSVAISMYMRAANKTLTDKDANKVQNKVLKRVNSSLGAELRQN